MLIFGPISLTPKRVILPYDINNIANQKVQFTAKGGDGAFIFSTANTNVLSISQSGMAESHFERVKNQESSTILVKASLARNIHVFKEAEVLFYPPVKLEIVGYSEAALNDYIDLHIGIYAQPNGVDYLPFTSCQNVQIDIEFSTQIFTISSMDFDIEKVENACRVIRLKGVHTGTSQVTVSYHHGDEKLKDDAQLVIYEPLITINPESNVLVLPIGSSRNVIYQHGPRKIFNMGSELMRTLQYSSDIASVKEINGDFQEQRFGYEVLCRKVGDTKVHLEIFNVINQKNFMKKSAIVETIVHCVKPRFINLLSLDKLKSSCPIDSKTLLHVRSLQDLLEIDIEILDQQKRKLQNISSLFIDLTFSQPSGNDRNKIQFIRENENDEIDGVPIPKRSFIRTSISDITTSHKIKAVVTNYEDSILRRLQINPESPVFGITKAGSTSKELVTPLIENELDLFSFDSSPLPVSSLSVFLSKSQVRLKLRQGSGYYDLKVKDSSILEVKFDKTSSELVIIPKKVGETVVEINDKCLKTETAKLFVSVVTIGRIELLSSDRVEKSKKIEAIARFFDTNDELIDFDYNNIEIYDISEQIVNEKILKVSMDRQFDGLGLGEVKYIITGNELGETKVTVWSGGKSVSSSPANIQVFSPLKLLPRNATIFVGSSLEISYRGGPYRGEDGAASIVYSVGNSEILGIDGNIVEGLKLGKTRVVGKCIGSDPKDGSQIVFSEDHIYVTVIPLSKISIRSPLKKIKAGNIMPLTLWAEDVSPMVLGTLKGLRIRWENDSPDVVELTDVFENLGVIYHESDAIAMRLRGLKQGRAKISVTVSYSSSSKLKSSIEVVVFKSLELDSPKRIVHDPIIIPPKTNIQLKVNLDQTVFEVNDADFGRNPVLNVTQDGNVQTFDSLGTGLVVATCMNDGQKLDIPIEVKQIHYIMASVNGNVKLREIQSNLPKNLNFPISISVHDNLGNKFSHNIEDDIKWNLSKKRSSTEIHIAGNSTLNVELLREGTDVLAVSLKDSTGMKFQEDFVKFAIQDDVGVFSKNIQATLGDFICFESPLSNNFNWESQNSDIIHFQGSVGHVLGTPSNGGSQKVIVKHGTDSGFFMRYEVSLHQPDRIQFEKRFDIFNGQLYRGYFSISNHYQSNFNKQKALITNNITSCGSLKDDYSIDFVTCQLSSNEGVSRLFATKVVFEGSTGSYACEIHALTTLDEITSLSRSKTISFQLEAQLNSGIYDKIDLKLTPAVQIFPLSFNFEKLHQQELVITGMENILQKIELNTSHPDNLVIIPLPKTSSGKLNYKLRLNDPSTVDSELFISVTSLLTHQKVVIPILPESHTEKLVSDEKSWIVDIMSNLGKIIAITVLVLTTVALFLMCQRNQDLDASGGEFIMQL
jgi:nuclear pore complex protein Nup210